jgi:hypothetical protein
MGFRVNFNSASASAVRRTGTAANLAVPSTAQGGMTLAQAGGNPSASLIVCAEHFYRWYCHLITAAVDRDHCGWRRW